VKQTLHRLSETALSAWSWRLGLTRRLQRRNVARIAIYHSVTDEPDPLFGLSAAAFARQVAFLARHYRVVALEEVAEMAAGRRAWIERAVALTFDDGYEDTYLVAFPILKKHRLPATIFVTTDYLGAGEPIWLNRLYLAVLNAPVGTYPLPAPLAADLGSLSLGSRAQRQAAAALLIERLYGVPPAARKGLVDEIAGVLEASSPPSAATPSIARFLGWGQLREMADTGLITIGSHGCSHSIVSRLDDDGLREELTASKAVIERELDRPVHHFAYPNGTPSDWDDRAIELLQDTGYRTAVTNCPGLVRAGANLFELPRVGYSGAHEATFAKRLEGMAFRDAARGLFGRGDVPAAGQRSR